MNKCVLIISGYSPTVGSMDQWATQVNDDFWTWDNAYPAYKRSCDFQPPDYSKIDPLNQINFDPSAFDHNGGPLHVSYGNYIGPAGRALQAAMDSAGLRPISGLNSGQLIGYSTMTATVDTRTATRDSSETSFLQAGARASSNLKIYPDALVKRVTFDGNRRATGVDVQFNSANVDLSYHLTASREVILSAGVWHSPQILMVSGVGPQEVLNQYGIGVVSDLPGVGQNQWVSANCQRSMGTISCTHMVTGPTSCTSRIRGQRLHKHTISGWQPGGGRIHHIRLFQPPIGHTVWCGYGLSRW